MTNNPWYWQFRMGTIDPYSTERKLLSCGPLGLPQCCKYHATGGHGFVGCKVDPFEPDLDKDPPGSQFRRGFSGGWQP